MSKLPVPKPGILEIAPYVAGKSKASGDLNNALGRVIKLSSNESAIGPSPKAVEAYQEAASKLYRYPDSGVTAVREAIAEVHGLDASRIVCGAGSDELIGMLVNAYAGEGDEVLYSEHGFLMYKIYTQAAGATPVEAPEKNLHTTVDNLLAAVTPRTKIVFVANPNNPTGTLISGAELKRLRDGLPPHVILAVDAAYAEYVETPGYSDGLELVNTTPNTVMLRTFSKIYGLPALRLGWGYFPVEIAGVLNRIRGPFNVSAPAIAAGAAAVRDREHVQRSIEHNKRWIRWIADECHKLGLETVPSVGNFLLVKFPDAKSAAAANAYLLDHSIIVRDVIGYKLPEHLRVTVGLEEENRELIAQLAKFLGK